MFQGQAPPILAKSRARRGKAVSETEEAANTSSIFNETTRSLRIDENVNSDDDFEQSSDAVRQAEEEEDEDQAAKEDEEVPEDDDEDDEDVDDPQPATSKRSNVARLSKAKVKSVVKSGKFMVRIEITRVKRKY